MLTMTSSPTQLSFYGNDVNLWIEMMSPSTQFSFHGNDVVPYLEVASPPTQFFFDGNDVIAYVIPSKVLEFSRKTFNQSALNSF